MTPTTAHPLAWPPGRPRTPAHRRARPKFTAPPMAQARDGLLRELRLLGATGVILSTNVELRQDGLPYANRRQPDDPAVAVYFKRKGRALCLTCDLWGRVEENIDALARWVEAQRGQERWVGADMVDAAFTGFAALPAAPGRRAWWDVLGCHPYDPGDVIQEAYRLRARSCHPDRGGSHEAMTELNRAFGDAKAERGF